MNFSRDFALPREIIHDHENSYMKSFTVRIMKVWSQVKNSLLLFHNYFEKPLKTVNCFIISQENKYLHSINFMYRKSLLIFKNLYNINGVHTQSSHEPLGLSLITGSSLSSNV